MPCLWTEIRFEVDDVLLMIHFGDCPYFSFPLAINLVFVLQSGKENDVVMMLEDEDFYFVDYIGIWLQIHYIDM